MKTTSGCPLVQFLKHLIFKITLNLKLVLIMDVQKVFFVNALRIVGCDAWGEDISEYAVENCHPNVRDYVSLPNDKEYDLLICKDVLEHVEVEDIPSVLQKFKKKSNSFSFVIPLGDDDRFRIREYEVDITHVTKKDEEWWIKMFESQGLTCKVLILSRIN